VTHAGVDEAAEGLRDQRPVSHRRLASHPPVKCQPQAATIRTLSARTREEPRPSTTEHDRAERGIEAWAAAKERVREDSSTPTRPL